MTYNTGKTDAATKGKKVLIHKFYKTDDLKNKIEEISHTEIISEEGIRRFSHWELEYDFSKIVGTYDQVIKPHKKIGDLLGFQEKILWSIEEVKLLYS